MLLRKIYLYFNFVSILFSILNTIAVADQKINIFQHLVPSPKSAISKGTDILQIQKLQFQFQLEEENQNTSDAFKSKQQNIRMASERKNFLNKNDPHLASYYKIIDKYINQRFHQKSDNQETTQVQVKLALIDQPGDIQDVQKMVESYKIIISKQIGVQLFCHGYHSFLRALETLFQLLQHNEQRLQGLPIEILDEPSYQWRGIMYDTARHFIEVNKLKSHIEAMRMSKFNVLQIHFSDSDSFPVEIPQIPEISEYGAYSKEEVYTLETIKELQQFANENGIILVPEFDAPGHSRSWSLSPEYQITNACYKYDKHLSYLYCFQPPCGALDPSIDKTWELVGKITDYILETFKSEYIHMGGDEVDPGCWIKRKSIKEWMDQNGISSYRELENYFRLKQAKLIPENKKRIYWLDPLSKTVVLQDSDIIQYWGKEKSYKSLLGDKKNNVILSTSDYLYLDCGMGSWNGGKSWCDPFKTFEKIYSFDPRKAEGIAGNVLGASAAVWSEVVSNNNLDSKVWPRTVSLAMRLWNVEEKLQLPDLVKKLVVIGDAFKDTLDIDAAPITTEYCARNVDMCFFTKK